MSVSTIRLLFDFGLLVLIWIVQRIIYPGFLHFSEENLIKYHREYTSRFTFIVMPLMLGQVSFALYQLILEITPYSLISIIILLLLWLSTFLQFVPIHATISKGIVNKKLLNQLVNKNWIRTFLWTLLFLLSCIQTV